VPDSQDTWIGDWQDQSTVRNSYLYLTGSSWKSLAHSEYKAQGMMSAGFTGPVSLSHHPGVQVIAEPSSLL
jgi:StAR-related lipid transfer protein 9